MDQHYLSRCYLNEFNGLNKQFYSINMKLLEYGKRPTPRLKSAGEVCYEKDFYTLDFKLFNKYKYFGANEPYALENSFHWYEAKYPKVIRQIRQFKQELPINDAYLLAYAAIDFKLRNKYHRNNAIENVKERLLNDSIVSIANELSEELLKSFDIERSEAVSIMRDIDSKLRTSPFFGREMHHYSMLYRKSNTNSTQNQIALNLLQANWYIFIAPASTEFITSDNPGFCMDRKEIAHNTRFAAEYGFILPLTPKHCLIITDEFLDYQFNNDSANKQLHYREAGKELVDITNKGAQAFYNQYLFAYSKEALEHVAKLASS